MMDTIDRVAVVTISENHIDGLRECVEVVAGERLYLSSIEPPDAETLRVAAAKHIADRLPFMVAVNGGTVVGWCGVAPVQKKGFGHTGTLGIGTLSDYRGRGIGAALLRSTLCKAKEMGLVRIELEVFRSNENAIKFYAKHAFQVEGCKKKAHCIDGVYGDVIIMSLLF